MQNDLSVFWGLRLKFLWEPLWSHFSWSFFFFFFLLSIQQCKLRPTSLPPLLLLLPAASSSSLTSVPNTVNSEALCAAVVVTLQAKAKSLWNISLCMVLTELAPSFFGWPEETRGRQWLVLSAAYAAFKYSQAYFGATSGGVFSFYCGLGVTVDSCEPWVPPTGIVAKHVTVESVASSLD